MAVKVRAHPTFARRIRLARLGAVAERALRAERVPASATIYVTGNSEIRKLNRQFHATNAATDVLSFPARSTRERRGAGPGDANDYLGDIVISYERARVQARTARWRIEDELDLLAVHGILHLLGYDDGTPAKRKRMWERQAEILGHAIK